MAGGIFISYRRDDTRHVAGRLAGDLAEHFGHERIFRDIETIEPGVDFVEALNKALGGCVVMLVMIGDRWLTITDPRGRRRLDDPHDWTRLEVSTALQRGIRVVPVLVEGAALPAEDDLPDDLKPLVRRQALQLADGRWRGDLQALVDALARVKGLEPVARAPQAAPAPPSAPLSAPLSAPAPPPAKGGKGQLWAGVGIGVVGLLVVAAFFGGESGDEPRRVNPPVEEVPAPAPPPSKQVVVPAPAPVQIAPAPAPPPAAPRVIDLQGPWRSVDGTEAYQFEQSGSQLRITAFSQGINIGQGSAMIDGHRVQLQMSLALQGIALASVQCNAQASQDLRTLMGTCNGPNGPFPMHFVR
jgi:hypothetical protein